MEGKQFGIYKIMQEIGRGSFGTVYKSQNTTTKEIVALKLEEASSFDTGQLENEYQVYKSLRNVKGICKIEYFGKQDNYFYLAMSILGPSLSEIQKLRKNMTVKSVCMVGKKIVKVLSEIHEMGWIYRDMKPENILFRGKDLYLIDFGMCKKYIVDGKHIPLINNKILTGTARYASVNTHKGLEQSRRDDLEGLGYVLMYLLKGDLPWMGKPAPTRKEKYILIGDIKEKTTSEALCDGLPGEKYFVRYLDYVKKLKFEEAPNYAYLIGLFDDILRKYKLADDGVFDWCDRTAGDKENGKKGAWTNLKTFFDKF